MKSEDDYKRPTISVGFSMGGKLSVKQWPLAKCVRFTPNRLPLCHLKAGSRTFNPFCVGSIPIRGTK